MSKEGWTNTQSEDVRAIYFYGNIKWILNNRNIFKIYFVFWKSDVFRDLEKQCKFLNTFLDMLGVLTGLQNSDFGRGWGEVCVVGSSSVFENDMKIWLW